MKHDIDPATREWMLKHHSEQLEFAEKMRKAHQAPPEPKAVSLAKKLLGACVLAIFSLLLVAYTLSALPMPGGTK